ncbi:hypothetical protein Tco_0969528 [Tanacetum coccineum]
MALPAQNINHSAFRSMFDKEKLSGNNFNDWFARLKFVLRVEKKMHVIELLLPPAPKPIAEPQIMVEWTTLYDAHTEIACLMLGSMTLELHRQFELYYSNYEVTCEEEAKRRNSRTKTKTFEESTKTATIRRIQEGRYGISAPAHHKNMFLSILYTAYPLLLYTPY